MKFSLRILSLILAVALLLSLCGCDQEQDYDDKIIITDDTRPPAHLSERAEGVFYSLLKYYYEQTTVQNLPESTLEQIETASEEIAVAIEKTPLSDANYSAMLDMIDERGVGIVDEIIAAERGEQEGKFGEIKSLYVDLCRIIGADHIGSIFYNVALYVYTYRTEKNLRNYEKYGYSYMLEDAEKYRESGRILSEDIGRNRFVTFLSGAVALGEILLGDSIDESMASFSDEELLLFVKSIDLEINIPADGWHLLLSELMPYLSGELTSKIITAMERNADLYSVSTVMGDVVYLLSFIQDNLTVADMPNLRSGDRTGIMNSAFVRFGDAEWEIFRRVTTVSLNTEDYESILKKEYGQDFIDYSSSITPISLDELRLSAGSDKFNESLKAYIGGISPAFSYGIDYDKG